ncbi:MAG TPA: acyl-CoA dehydrogenase family protein [Candidatus Limnocylindrales bacterium]|nr:acyl-CoA dehydrogenase family protein [Candidatus Limnocylindrales bacterium]
MSFALSQHHHVKKEEFRNFAVDELDTGPDFPRENLKKAAERGYLGLPVPKEWGGGGEDFLTYILLIEEISRVCAATGVIVAVHTSLGNFPLLNYGTPAQKERYLAGLAKGNLLGAFALTEASAGSDAAALSTSAVPVDGGYRLNGCKLFITSGGEADMYTVFTTVDFALGRKGITAFLVEKGTPGFKAGKIERKMGLKRSHTTELLMEDVFLPAVNRLGQEGEGFSIAMSLLDAGRIGIAAQGLGLAQASIDYTTTYWRDQEAAGKKASQYTCFVLADLAARLEAARLLVYRAAVIKGAGRTCTKEASMAKMFATDLAMAASTKCIDLCDFEGASQDNPLAGYFCDAKATQIYEGSNQLQRIVIARAIL